MSKNILYSCPTDLPFGFGNVCIEEAKRLSQLAEVLFIKALPMQYKEIFFDIKVSTELNDSFSVYHGWAGFSYFSIREAKDYHIPTILNISSVHPELQQKLIQEKQDPFLIRKKEKELSLTDYIFVPSNFVKNSLTERDIDENKIILCRHGVDTDFFKVKKELKKEEEKFNLLFVGRPIKRKGWDLLIRNLTKDMNLIVVSTMIDDFSHILNKDIYYYTIASLAALKKIYSEASALILPSLEDGFGLVVLEALSCSLPVIVSNKVGAAELLTNKDLRDIEDMTVTRAGIIIPSHNKDYVRDAIEFMMNNYKSFNLKYCREIAEKYSWNRSLDTLEKFYKERYL